MSVSHFMINLFSLSVLMAIGTLVYLYVKGLRGWRIGITVFITFIMIAITALGHAQTSRMKEPKSAATSNITKEDFEKRGLKWPLSVNSGYLKCKGGCVTFTTLDSKTYGVNGIARSRYIPIEPIWLFDEKMMADLKSVGAPDSEVRINIGDLIDEGLKLCL